MRRHIHEGSGVGRWCVLAFTVCASFCLHAQERLQPVAEGRSLSASRQARPPAPAAGQRAQTTPPATAGLFKGRRPSAGGEWTGTSTWPGLSLQIRISVDPTGATVTSLFTQVDCTSGRGGARNEWSGESEIDDAGRFAFPGELGRKTKGRFGPDSFASGAMRFSALTRAFEGHFVSDDVIEGTYSSPVELKCGDEFARVTGAWTARRRDAAPAPANAQAGPATRSADPAPAGAFSIRDEYFINRSFQETSPQILERQAPVLGTRGNDHIHRRGVSERLFIRQRHQRPAEVPGRSGEGVYLHQGQGNRFDARRQDSQVATAIG